MATRCGKTTKFEMVGFFAEGVRKPSTSRSYSKAAPSCWVGASDAVERTAGGLPATGCRARQSPVSSWVEVSTI